MHIWGRRSVPTSITDSGQQEMVRENQMAKSDFFPPEFSLSLLWCVAQKVPGPEMKGTVILLISATPSFHHLHPRLNNPSHSFYRGYSYKYTLSCEDCFILLCFHCITFKSLIKISLFIIQSFVWVQRSMRPAFGYMRNRTLKPWSLVVCTMFSSYSLLF